MLDLIMDEADTLRHPPEGNRSITICVPCTRLCQIRYAGGPSLE
jgi:hypothetical protein